MKLAVSILVLSKTGECLSSTVRLCIPEEYGDNYYIRPHTMHPLYTVIGVWSSTSSEMPCKFCVASRNTVSGWYSTPEEAIKGHKNNDLEDGPVTITYQDRWGNMLPLTIKKIDRGYEIDDGSSKTTIKVYHVFYLYEYLEEKYPFSSYIYMNENGLYPDPYWGEEMPGISLQGGYAHYGPR